MDALTLDGVQLNSGLVFENQFLMALSKAGIDKHLRPDVLQQYAPAHTESSLNKPAAGSYLDE